jgi:hypothetical protein
LRDAFAAQEITGPAIVAEPAKLRNLGYPEAGG